jgi:hypothetical protein
LPSVGLEGCFLRCRLAQAQADWNRLVLTLRCLIRPALRPTP